MLQKPPSYEKRDEEQLRQHYEVEKELANRLKTSTSPEERSRLYPTLYDELYRRVPLHPRLTRKYDPHLGAEVVEGAMRLLRPFLLSQCVFLEVGAGDCGLSLAVAKHVKKVYALEVSQEATKHVKPPTNCEVIISDGRSIPLPDGSITVAYSHQVMEHIHPEDAVEQVRNIYKVLADGGQYICITPNRMDGPHDISKYFDRVATGLHMREYTAGELHELFVNIGFSRVGARVGIRGNYVRVSVSVIKAVERFLQCMPCMLRTRLVQLRGIRNLLFITLVATK